MILEIVRGEIMLFAFLFRFFLTLCVICLEMVFLHLPRQKLLSFLPLLLRALMVTLVFWLTSLTLKVSFHALLLCTMILCILLFAEMGVLFRLRSTSSGESRLTLLILPLSLTRTSILAFALGGNIPVWWIIASSSIGFFSLFPMLTILQIYESQEQTWENLAETTLLLLKDPWYRKQGITWRRTSIEAWTVLRAGYRKWKSGFWFVSRRYIRPSCSYRGTE
jgi:hypothetical protein